MAIEWYVLSSKPAKEESLYQHVLNEGIEAFYPRIYAPSTNPTVRKYKPYFPGYLFVHLDLDVWGISKLRWMPHANGLVTFEDNAPPMVPENLIAALQRKMDELAALAPEKGVARRPLKSGDAVEILEGPFAGYNAIFDASIDGKERVRVLLQLLSGRTVPVEIRAGSLKRPNQPNSKTR